MQRGGFTLDDLVKAYKVSELGLFYTANDLLRARISAASLTKFALVKTQNEKMRGRALKEPRP